jgi:hypothetical protein
MKLLTKELKKKIPKLYEQDGLGDNATVYVKLFCPWNYWKWHILEFDGNDQLFCYVKGDFDEFGYVSLSELEAIRGPYGLRIERDIYFQPIKLRNLLD